MTDKLYEQLDEIIYSDNQQLLTMWNGSLVDRENKEHMERFSPYITPRHFQCIKHHCEEELCLKSVKTYYDNIDLNRPSISFRYEYNDLINIVLFKRCLDIEIFDLYCNVYINGHNIIITDISSYNIIMEYILRKKKYKSART